MSIETIDISECQVQNNAMEAQALQTAIEGGYDKESTFAITYLGEDLFEPCIYKGNILMVSTAEQPNEDSTLLVDRTKTTFIIGTIFFVDRHQNFVNSIVIQDNEIDNLENCIKNPNSILTSAEWVQLTNKKHTFECTYIGESKDGLMTNDTIVFTETKDIPSNGIVFYNEEMKHTYVAVKIIRNLIKDTVLVK